MHLLNLSCQQYFKISRVNCFLDRYHQQNEVQIQCQLETSAHSLSHRTETKMFRQYPLINKLSNFLF